MIEKGRVSSTPFWYLSPPPSLESKRPALAEDQDRVRSEYNFWRAIKGKIRRKSSRENFLKLQVVVYSDKLQKVICYSGWARNGSHLDLAHIVFPLLLWLLSKSRIIALPFLLGVQKRTWVKFIVLACFINYLFLIIIKCNYIFVLWIHWTD